MNIKIQGGGKGVYANTGSCSGVAKYLTHEASELGFFRGDRTDIPIEEVVAAIDNNKAKLCRDDAKFFCITISPSADEIRAMGSTPEEQEENFKKYAAVVMDIYAKGFNNGLRSDDLLFFMRMHKERKKTPQRGKEQAPGLHIHAIMSRKDIHNKKKMSPMTNIKDGARGGTVKTGFCREAFYEGCESAFDKMFQHQRSYKDGYRYLTMRKNGTAKDLSRLGWAEGRMEQQQFEKELVSLHDAMNSAIDGMDIELSQEQEQTHGVDVAIDSISTLAQSFLTLFYVSAGGGGGGQNPNKKKRKKGYHL